MISNINKFIPETDADKEYKYKFLVYPNITYSQDLEKDSYIVVLREIIRVLNKNKQNIHFTVIVPQFIKSLALFTNVKQIFYDMPVYPNQMRTDFRSTELLNIIDWVHNDFDVLYSHLPEHTLQLSNMFFNSTDISPVIIGYCHWYEIPENTSYNKNMFLFNIAGTLEMQECGVNSIWLKNLIIKKASKYYNDDIINKLNEIIQPHYLGINEIFSGENETIPKSIIFNHRQNEYTGFDWLIEILNELWKERQDFKLYTTMADIDAPYARKIVKNTREEYLNFIRKMSVGVSCFQKYSAWSIATTDGLSQGVPYILPNNFCYPEMVGSNYPLLYSGKEQFKNILNSVLDDDSKLKEAKIYLKPLIKDLLWDSRVMNWFNGWKFLDNLPKIKKSESYDRIVKYIKTKKSVSKSDILKHMNWGFRIPFNGYRNLLREEEGIKFTENRYIFEG